MRLCIPSSFQNLGKVSAREAKASVANFRIYKFISDRVYVCQLSVKYVKVTARYIKASVRYVYNYLSSPGRKIESIDSKFGKNISTQVGIKNDTIGLERKGAVERQ